MKNKVFKRILVEIDVSVNDYVTDKDIHSAIEKGIYYGLDVRRVAAPLDITDVKTKVFSNEGIPVWETWIKQLIVKKSGNPFKSGLKNGLVIEIVINGFSGKPAFRLDDDSIVDCKQCKLS